jgi:hypothetical protein
MSPIKSVRVPLNPSSGRNPLRTETDSISGGRKQRSDRVAGQEQLKSNILHAICKATGWARSVVARLPAKEISSRTV